jgi:hypothetical protein
MAWTVPPAETGAANLIAKNQACPLDHSPDRSGFDSAICAKASQTTLDRCSGAAFSAQKLKDRHVKRLMMPLIGLTNIDRYTFSLAVHLSGSQAIKNPCSKTLEVGVINSSLRMVIWRTPSPSWFKHIYRRTRHSCQ